MLLSLAVVALSSIALVQCSPGSSSTVDWSNKYTATAAASVYAAQATAKTSSPTSHVPGKSFDRFVIIWLENTDYTMAVGDPNLASLAKKGITLSNYFALTHPSEPNYVASFSGDNYGMDNDNFFQIPSNVTTVIDLLEDRGISWGAYQEDLPYSGFEGNSWVNQQTGANDYVRKHNPPIIHNSVAGSERRLSQVKNLTQFYADLSANKLPQWMFITPNMTSDGHDTSVTTAGVWTKAFLEPLLSNDKFMKKTLVLVTFDENHTYTQQNRVLGILLGDENVIPCEQAGTTDSNFYDHYSELSTVEANWGLNTLGRWDVGANVFSVVASKTGDKLRSWPAATGSNPTVFLNQSFAGPYSSTAGLIKPILPAPNISAISPAPGRRTVFPAVSAAWVEAYHQVNATYYNNGLEVPDGLRPPPGWAKA